MDEGSDKSPIKVDVGLSAKAEIKGEVPSSSLGRSLDALVDAFRPFTEARGLKADQIRLQREDVLLQIASKAQYRLALEGQQSKPVPLKFLANFMEKASQEDITNEILVDTWANLLASASVNERENHLIFLDILSRLDSKHVELLNFICFDRDRPLHYADAPYEKRETSCLYNLKSKLKEIEEKKTSGEILQHSDLESLIDIGVDFFDFPGAKISNIEMYSDEAAEGSYYKPELEDKIISDDYPESIIFALKSVGLIDVVSIDLDNFYSETLEFGFFLHAAVVTHLGAEMYATCIAGPVSSGKTHE
ncbi:hypothetical protein [Hoeflea sp.]|uniref:Abi-alpha family protein n=1 Tax=Hoeflea sp. TaxID=1940281 RepID=UPI003A9323A6